MTTPKPPTSPNSFRAFPVPRLIATAVLVVLIYNTARDILARFGAAFYKNLVSETILGVLLICLIFFTAALVYIWRPGWFTPLNRLRDRLPRPLRTGLALLLPALPAVLLLFSRWSEVFSGDWLRAVLYLTTAGSMAWLLSEKGRSFSWSGLLVGTLLFCAEFFLIQAMQDVVDYPFSLTWSEGNRIWDYSVRFGRRLYDFPADQTIPAYIDKGRQSLWGLPFLFFDPQIWQMRLWDAILFSLPYLFLGLAVFPREKGRTPAWLLGSLWVMLFLNQGPIYTPLVFAATLTALARKRPTWLAALLVFAAGYLAGISRMTWIFAPSIWAAMVALADPAPRGATTPRQRWLRAILLAAAGMIGSVGIKQLSKIFAAGSTPSAPVAAATQAGASGLAGLLETLNRQPLVWSRLLPNATYEQGILLGLLLAIGPLLIICFGFILRRKWQPGLWPVAAISGSLAAFLLVGLIVSVKVGGGNNLHNLDMFLITLVFFMGLVWYSNTTAWWEIGGRGAFWLRLLLLAAVVLPVWNNLATARVHELPEEAKVSDALSFVRQYVERGSQNGEVLFLDQRQLLTFGEVPRVPLVAAYEKKRMMDEAMADNAAFFAPFFADLSRQRFEVIISEPLQISFQKEDREFNIENNSFVNWVSLPVLCYYEPVKTFPEVKVEILVPRSLPNRHPRSSCPGSGW